MTKIKLLDPQHWVGSHADYLYSFAITRINDEDLARDLVQETFLAALEGRDYFEGKSSERTWLTAILKNKIVDVYRKKSAEMQVSRRQLNETIEVFDFFERDSGHWKEDCQPEPFGIEDNDVIMNKEFSLILEQCLKKLPALWRSVFTLKHMDELSTDKICNELNVTSANFWVIIHRAKVNLRACLQKNWR